MKNLEILKKKLIDIDKNKKLKKLYTFPNIWSTKTYNTQDNLISINPIEFYINQIDWIINNKTFLNNTTNLETTKNPIVYNLFTRFTTAFDHNQDGIIKNIKGEFKETGTLLKAIALLPYLKKLNIDIIYLLPITSIGKYNKKGNLGSPYSIFNPYKLDENLNEPLLNMSIETLFETFVEAAHLLDIKVVLEFVFRTASIDSELSINHPEWFYWIKSQIKNKTNNKDKNSNNLLYSAPIFTKEQLIKIKEQVENSNFNNLPAPSANYINMFCETPKVVTQQKDGKIIGITDTGQEVQIPSAFADWPPNDTQPEWTDITYLKLYDNAKFNYIAYNTIRMYDDKLARPENEQKELWEHIENIVPFYQNKFNIDGVMIDMGHAIPKKLIKNIIKQTRTNNKNFLFWEENFIPNKKSAEIGYDNIIGYLPFDAHKCEKMQELIYKLEQKKFPIKFFATSETHNTPRSASRSKNPVKFNKLMYTVNAMLPLPLFLHSGFELCEKFPVNIGLEFENINTDEFTVDKLPLFSIAKLKWEEKNNIIDYIEKINKIRKIYLDKNNNNEYPIYLWNNSTDTILIFQRIIENNKSILFIGNYSDNEEIINIKIPENSINILTNKKIGNDIKITALEAKLLLLQ